MPAHDWQAVFAAPPTLAQGDRFAPWSFRRPDGTVSTCYGSTKALLTVSGSHLPKLEPADYNTKLRGTGEFSDPPKGAAIDTINAQPVTPFATLPTSLMRNVIGTYKPQVKAVIECPECSGSGEHECPHCKQMMECDQCEGKGETESTPDDPLRHVVINGSTYNAWQLAPLLSMLPDESATLAHSPDKQRLVITGTGWQIVTMALNKDWLEPGAETVTLPLSSPNVPAL